MQTVTIRDVSRDPPRNVIGQLVRKYEKGITIDDNRGVRYYAFHHNVVSQQETGDLFV